MKSTQNILAPSTNPNRYYEFKREEILPFVPKNVTRVLDVGCGSGVFGEILKAERDAEVWGVEISQSNAEKAMERLDKILIGDIENGTISLPKKHFDCIIFNDVLEHLKSPWNVLEALRENLRDGGYIVASIPNVRYYKNIKNLLFKKDWKYVDEGILDRTHLRFFTLKTIPELFLSTGYDVLSITGINASVFSRKLRLFNWMCFNHIDDMRFLQFVCVAQNKGK
ncbi:MAG: class I SAM-dependent methyltransferase [Verrucomicrobiales bacterium]|nr:class I SAM-dependent methyltransferase [Nitrospinaceae bacterium]